MQYKTELHLHTSPASPCADLTPREVADRYISYGYTTVVVTNHYSDSVNDCTGETWRERVEYYLRDWRALKEYAGDKLNVLLGCELRFPQNYNDYLVFGLTEEFLYEHPDLYMSDIATFSGFARAHGLLLIQAHPFRNGIVIVRPEYLDGIEVFNGHHGHDSRNQLADIYAKRYHLLRTSGSDFHHVSSVESAGILTSDPVTSMEQLVEILKSGDCELICSGPAAKLDGMKNMPAKYE